MHFVVCERRSVPCLLSCVLSCVVCCVLSRALAVRSFVQLFVQRRQREVWCWQRRSIRHSGVHRYVCFAVVHARHHRCCVLVSAIIVLRCGFFPESCTSSVILSDYCVHVVFFVCRFHQVPFRPNLIIEFCFSADACFDSKSLADPFSDPKFIPLLSDQSRRIFQGLIMLCLCFCFR